MARQERTAAHTSTAAGVASERRKMRYSATALRLVSRVTLLPDDNPAVGRKGRRPTVATPHRPVFAGIRVEHVRCRTRADFFSQRHCTRTRVFSWACSDLQLRLLPICEVQSLFLLVSIASIALMVRGFRSNATGSHALGGQLTLRIGMYCYPEGQSNDHTCTSRRKSTPISAKRSSVIRALPKIGLVGLLSWICRRQDAM